MSARINQRTGADTGLKFRWDTFPVYYEESPENNLKIEISYKNKQRQVRKRSTWTPLYPPLSKKSKQMADRFVCLRIHYTWKAEYRNQM